VVMKKHKQIVGEVRYKLRYDYGGRLETMLINDLRHEMGVYLGYQLWYQLENELRGG